MTTTIGSLDLNALNDLYSDSNQYFWFESNSSATYGAGAHVTLVPDTTFISNPTGQNILINTDGFSIRNGLLPTMTLDNDSLDFNIVDTVGNTYTNAASFGISSTIGLTDGTQSYLYEDYHSLQMIDKGGHTYFYVSDLRDANGETTWTDTFTGDGTNRRFSLTLEARGNQYTVTVSDGSGGTPFMSSTELTFSSAPSDGATITATYLTMDYRAKAYTFGFRTGVVGPLSVAEGINTVASGFTSHAEGSVTTASGNYSHAEGFNAKAKGNSSHAEGYVTTASGSASHTEGSNTVASGIDAHAEGSATTASAVASHAEGSNTVASSTATHAEGGNTVASGRYSHAQNYGTKAQYDYQTVIGKYNNNKSNNLFEIGKGTANNARSNVFEVATSGNVVAAGDITDGSGNVLSNKQDKLSTTTWTPSITRSSGGTLSSLAGRKYGNVVTLRFVVTYSTSVSAGSNVFVGNLTNSGYIPPFATFASTYYGSVPLVCQLGADGKITCRVTGSSAVTISSGCTFGLTYIV